MSRNREYGKQQDDRPDNAVSDDLERRHFAYCAKIDGCQAPDSIGGEGEVAPSQSARFDTGQHVIECALALA